MVHFFATLCNSLVILYGTWAEAGVDLQCDWAVMEDVSVIV